MPPSCPDSMRNQSLGPSTGPLCPTRVLGWRTDAWVRLAWDPDLPVWWVEKSRGFDIVAFCSFSRKGGKGRYSGYDTGFRSHPLSLFSFESQKGRHSVEHRLRVYRRDESSSQELKILCFFANLNAQCYNHIGKILNESEDKGCWLLSLENDRG